ncbi:threonine ammonia-lyase [Auriculariales sp. MPI-PUGE-AT-0066]|nr:threonine ammonia-lyase [Auriculariales sp. MPI-PUGE-AT-0066]
MAPTSTTLEYSSNAPNPLSSQLRYGRLSTHHLLPDGTPDYLRLILTAKVYDLVKETPLAPAPNLSARLGNTIYLKREDLQDLTADERWKGVVTCSAGNHAQGVALSGRHLKVPCTIVMPHGTPSIKIRNVERLGAKVVLHGQDFDEAKVECARLAKAHGLVFVPPYDDPLVIAGQGTVGLEILRQLPSRSDELDVDGIFCAVGGGGLVSGVAEYVKRVGSPGTRIVGVETVDGDAMARSLEKGERVTLDEVGPFADGTAVKIVGEEPFRICKELIDGIVKTNNDEICAAIKDIFEETRSITEPAGALALAGLKAYILQNNLVGAGKTFVAVVSGANMNFSRLRFVAERADLGEGRETLLSVEIPEKPGSFFNLHSEIFPRVITEFSYRFESLPGSSTPPGQRPAHIYLSFLSESPLQRETEVADLIRRLADKGMRAVDISDNEMAKSHARYMVGGRSRVPNERAFRFEFPERPGALRKFLQTIPTTWNISLFHYRNHGADVGKILAGIQVPSGGTAEFEDILSKLGYPYVEETNNEVYIRYLRGQEP